MYNIYIGIYIYVYVSGIQFKIIIINVCINNLFIYK